LATRSTSSTTDHAALAAQYARDVVGGKIAVGRHVRAAAARHLRDLDEAAKRKRYPYEYVADKGARVCRFIERLPHTKGKWAAKHLRVTLQPWQCFIVCVLFGWLKRSDGKRRFRTAYLEIPRKNGKSLLAAGIGLYMLCADGEHGAEVYSGATTEKQAWEVFGPARLMAQKTPALLAKFGIEILAKGIAIPGKASKFQPLIGNPGDGASPSCAIVDEYHEHATSALYDAMETGMAAREQPLLLVITTAGSNIAGPCHDKHDEVAKVLEGTVKNDELFGCMWGLDPEDDWALPSAIYKANPNFGVSAEPEFLLSQQRQALQNPQAQNKFKTKHLNVWTSVLAGVMNMQEWLACADPMLEEEELTREGCRSIIAADLASKLDLCSEQRLYIRPDKNGRNHYYLFGRYWLPEAAIEEPGPNKTLYEKWRNAGLLIQTDGATVDFDLIAETIEEDARAIGPDECVFDPFNAVPMMQRLQAKKIVCVEFIQTPQNFAVPLDELLAAVKEGRLHHDGNEITTWCFSNMVARPAKKGLVSPSKQKAHQKIDGGIATIMAIARAAATPARPPAFQAFTLG
jgi:phage terminase large subunit-like protein